jgi:hypothetical protein
MLLTAVAAISATLALSAFALQNKEQDKGKPADAGAMMPMPKAGPEHAILKDLAGEWDCTVTMPAMTPGGKPDVSKGSEKCVLAMNDLWLVSDYTGTFMGGPFSGHGVTGYDTDKKKYVGFWVDTMTTAAEPMSGTYDAASKTLNMSMKAKDQTGKDTTMKMVTHFVDKDSHWFEIVGAGPDGKDMQMFKIEYKRKK